MSINISLNYLTHNTKSGEINITISTPDKEVQGLISDVSIEDDSDLLSFSYSLSDTIEATEEEIEEKLREFMTSLVTEAIENASKLNKVG